MLFFDIFIKICYNIYIKKKEREVINMAVYCCTDLHGRYDLFQAIKKFLKPEDTMYFLGDANDRGPDGWKLVKAILSEPNWIYIKGNHEEMLHKAMQEFLSQDDWDMPNYRHLIENGGYKTFEDWMQEEERFKREWLSLLRKLPLYKTYTNDHGLSFLLTHSGCTPIATENNGYSFENSSPELLWNRKHFIDIWDEKLETLVVVHGHTPNCFIDEAIHPEVKDKGVELGAYWYADCHKVCLDTGAVWTDTTVLLNLDTLEEEIIQIEEK